MTKNILGFELIELEDAMNVLQYYSDACKALNVEMTVNGLENFILDQIKKHPDRLKKH